MSDLRRVREFNNDRMCWGVVGDLGGIHIHCNTTFQFGGFEIHGIKPLSEGAPMSEDDCWLIGKKCCHDGSASWWDRTGRYILEGCVIRQNDDAMWRKLESLYEYCLANRNWPAGPGVQT